MTKADKLRQLKDEQGVHLNRLCAIAGEIKDVEAGPEILPDPEPVFQSVTLTASPVELKVPATSEIVDAPKIIPDLIDPADLPILEEPLDVTPKEDVVPIAPPQQPHKRRR